MENIQEDEPILNVAVKERMYVAQFNLHLFLFCITIYSVY